MSSLRDLLRQRTRAAHDALEATATMRAFATGSLTARQYRDYLTRQLQLHAPLEAALSRWVPAGFAELRLRKSEWLRADLQTLGGPAIDAPARVPPITSSAQAWGVLYVLEGGTLGLQVVRKRFQADQQADQHADHPALQGAGRFLHGYGADTGRHWRVFVAALEALPESQWPGTVAAACATFTAFHDRFADAPALST